MNFWSPNKFTPCMHMHVQLWSTFNIIIYNYVHAIYIAGSIMSMDKDGIAFLTFFVQLDNALSDFICGEYVCKHMCA